MTRARWVSILGCGLVFWGTCLALPGSLAHVRLVAGCWSAVTGLLILSWSRAGRRDR